MGHNHESLNTSINASKMFNEFLITIVILYTFPIHKSCSKRSTHIRMLAHSHSQAEAYSDILPTPTHYERGRG